MDFTTYRKSAVRLLAMLCGAMLAGCMVNAHFNGLKPVTPEYKESYSFVGRYDESATLSVEVDSLQPLLRWEAFPRPEYLPGDPGKLIATISNVTYELKILNLAAGVVYERKGLTTPYHKVEASLQTDTIYSWSVRAQFDLDGHPKVTRWSSMTVEVLGDKAQYSLPHDVPLRFKTPGI